MKSRLVATYAVGVAVALTMLGSQTAAAQSTGSGRDTTTRRTTPRKATSTQRIPVVKESPGEVVPVDTATPPPPPPPPVVEAPAPPPPPVAEVIPAPVIRPMRHIGPLYLMLGAGPTLASGNAQTASWNEELCVPGVNGDPVSTAHKVGFASLIGVGYDAPKSPLGVRFDVGYAKYTTTVANTPEPKWQFHSEPEMYTGNLDLKLRAPWINPFHNRFDVYAVGGATYNRWHATDVQNGPANPSNLAVATRWRNQWGYNAGAGLEFGWGVTSIFAETRWFRFNDTPGINHVPVIFGLRFF